ncbi:hypothetical protein [Alteriqipengyuania lutimaris]|uniref:Uncharacterized protein n=1 Tax=Alteriqipengyuania lutimaris TaxID=1538146 RepID=A0A395LJY2_9SPHN|nr:hypothetical protein [Alteriqipengyuania lutimaris]MBB3034042.1 hypothetical protein [Alteriqipengyuania lutimaris]RDS77015.1 hypothetical protein DL238_04920 [Alteriqipengyuania lutimaris]
MTAASASAQTSMGFIAAPSTLAEVEAALIDCQVLWWRSPGGTHWPFAGDAPWHLMQRSVVAGDYGGEGVDGVAVERAPRTALDAAEVSERDRVTAWLDLLEDPLDRQVVWMATARLQKGEACVPWSKIRRWAKSERTPRALEHRYLRGLALILCQLNGWPVNRARAIALKGIDRARD